MRTLEYERGARGGQAGGYVSVGANAFDVFELAQRTKRGGQPVLDDPLVADEMVGFLMEIQALTLNGQRTQVPELIADRPQGIPLASKLMGTEMSRRLNDFAVRLTGVRGAYYVDEPEAADNGLWARNYLNAFSATIGGGTSQIQANIVGEHVLGLPKS
jgi:alkylation response protein AidB-like acyl-CoA dehydrogenase